MIDKFEDFIKLNENVSGWKELLETTNKKMLNALDVHYQSVVKCIRNNFDGVMTFDTNGDYITPQYLDENDELWITKIEVVHDELCITLEEGFKNSAGSNEFIISSLDVLTIMSITDFITEELSK